jgi:hypothetical protein
MSDDQIVKLIESLTAKSIRLEARCDALDVVLCALAKHHGIDPAKVAAAVEKMTSHYHQKRLERIETLDPGTGAGLDYRTGLPDLFD